MTVLTLNFQKSEGSLKGALTGCRIKSVAKSASANLSRESRAENIACHLVEQAPALRAVSSPFVRSVIRFDLQETGEAVVSGDGILDIATAVIVEF